ncbi:hypothetical protein M0534_06115 [Methylonatrum kenyense]|uniref:hypothetical protein n=1 Tax=Methylonatrum kenyense TaxID=455253 RepID=UPI0020BEEB2D|nr:hypothetical protein [Methylonatrum kenyense]MCK8515900.1 hypothetical protein [Methylonatrum kenyense]
MMQQSDSGNHRRGSVARGGGATQTILLPAVKLDLGVLVLALLCLWFGVMIAPLSRPLELLTLFGGSLLGAGWLAWRIRRALARARQELAREADDGTQQE